MLRASLLVVAVAVVAIGLSALRADVVHADEPAAGNAPSGTPAPVHEPHAFAKVSDRIYRSAQPDTEAEFAAIAAAGIKTIVSVDGARPDVETAAKYGLRYVHVPIGYDGISDAKAAVICKAVSTLEGPFLFHCHHGKHRGPAACMIAYRFLDGADAAAAKAEMKKAGTADKYAGLYRDVERFAGVDPAVLAAIPKDLPAAVTPAGFTKAMVEMDHGWDLVKAVKDAGWATPKDHPDVAPAHQVVILAEALREMSRMDEVKKKSEDFRTRLAATEKLAWDLAGVLDEPKPDAKRAGELYDALEKSCATCHAAHRDNKR